MIYKAMGDLEKALEFQLKDTKILEEVLEPNHPDSATSYNNLAVIYLDMGKYRKALPYGEKAVAILQHLFPNGHPDLDKFKKKLALIKKKIK